jgi:hypothetical protein
MDSLSLTMDMLTVRDRVGKPKIMDKNFVHTNGSLTPSWPWIYECPIFFNIAKKIGRSALGISEPKKEEYGSLNLTVDTLISRDGVSETKIMHKIFTHQWFTNPTLDMSAQHFIIDKKIGRSTLAISDPKRKGNMASSGHTYLQGWIHWNKDPAQKFCTHQWFSNPTLNIWRFECPSFHHRQENRQIHASTNYKSKQK